MAINSNIKSDNTSISTANFTLTKGTPDNDEDFWLSTVKGEGVVISDRELDDLFITYIKSIFQS